MDFAAALTIVRKEQPTVSDVHVGAEIGHHRAEAGRKGKKRKGKKPLAQSPQISVAYLQKSPTPPSKAHLTGASGVPKKEQKPNRKKRLRAAHGPMPLSLVEKSDDSLTAQPMVGVGDRRLEPFDDDTLFSPLKYSPAALGQLRPDQVPRFLDAVTHPKRLPLAQVKIKDLQAIKSRVGRDVVQKHLDAPDDTKPPVVVRMAGGLYVGDGHDRLAAKWLNGDDHAEVHFADIEPYSENKPDPDVDHDEPRWKLLQGADGRTLQSFKDGTMGVPFRFDPAFMANIRPDQVPKFLDALTHQKAQPAGTVDLRSVVAIQDRVNPDTVAAHVEQPSKKLPVIVKMNGEHYIADGHDRLSAAWLRGEDTAKVRIKDITGKPNNLMKAGVRIDVTKTDDDQRLVFGWFSVSTIDGQPVVDKQSDIIDTVDLEKAVYDYVLHHRAQGDMHGADQKGRLVESMMFTSEKQKALGIDLGREGWFGGFRVDDGDVWKAIKRGERPEFSIGGTAIPVEA